MVNGDYQKILQLIHIARRGTPSRYYEAIRKYSKTLDDMKHFGNTKERNTVSGLLLDLELENLGKYKDSFSPDAGPAFRQILAKGINMSKEPYLRIESLVRHCCYQPSQRKIEDGAEVLSTVTSLYSFVKDKDQDLQGQIPFSDRVWLYSLAFSWEADHPDKDKFIDTLCVWICHTDSCVREFAAHALGSLNATRAREAFHRALSKETNPATREGLLTTIANIES